MPATSEKQRRLFAIAEHHPEILYARNRKLAQLPTKTLHDFASSTTGGRKKTAVRRLSDYATSLSAS